MPPADLDGLSHSDLKSLVLKLLEETAELRRTVASQRDEIARLKGGSGRPNIKPSGMDQATEPKPPSGAGAGPRPKGGKTSRLSIHEERTVKVASPPDGSRFKGYANFIVQDLVIRPHVVNFRCERWQTPDGATLTAALPEGITGHFGPQLRRFVLAQYHQGQVTMPRLLALLRSVGILISKRQLVRLLIAGQDGFLNEARDVLRAGLTSAAWITVDDTGARHKAANGFCTQIGNAHFAWFGTTGSKSRSNFLALLRAGHGNYVINAEAVAYMRHRALAGPVIARLAEHPHQSFADHAAWTAHLDQLGIAALKVNPDPVMVATEGALWGSIKAHGFLPNTVIVSDDAGQFNVGQHGLCWVHPSGSSTSSTPSRMTSASPSAKSANSSGGSIAISKPIASIRPRNARPPCGHGLTVSSAAKPASSPSTACSRGSMPTKANCSWCWIGPKSRSTPTGRKTTSAAKSPSARSAAAPEATPVATAAMPSSASPRPAQSSESHSGTISARVSLCQTIPMSQPCRNSSSSAAPPPDRHKFCPSYENQHEAVDWKTEAVAAQV
jgi:hypothetical protein